MENVHFLALFKTFFFFLSFFSFHNIKNDLFWYDYCKKGPIKKVRFLDKIHGITRLKNVHFLPLVKTSISWSYNDCFLFKKSKNDLFWRNFCEKKRWEKVHFFNPFYNHSFLSTISKPIFSHVISLKNADKKKFDFWTKSVG